MNQISEWFSKQPEHVRSAVMLVLLSALVLAGFWSVTECDFVNFDDTDYVTENYGIQNGVTLRSIAWAFRTNHAGNWHPLTWISHMIDFSLYARKPAGHHFTNLLLHLGNTLLLFLVLKEMTRAIWRSLFVAALFAVHPMHVESVAWVSERKDLLSAFFAMLTFWFYMRHARERAIGEPLGKFSRRRNYYLALFMFSLGLLSKPMLVTLPFVLLLLDFWPLERLATEPSKKLGLSYQRFRLLFLEKLPFFALSFVCSSVTYFVQKGAGSVLVDPFRHRFLKAVGAYSDYLYKLIWPSRLCAFYPSLDDKSGLLQISSIVVLLCISLLVLASSTTRRYLFTGWFWFVGMLVPVIGFVQVGAQGMADRYSYLPSIGLFLLIIWLASEFGKSQKVLGFAATTIVIVFTAMTQRQVSFWRNSVTLFSHALAVTTETDTVQVQLGAALAYCGKRDEAISHFERALELNPKNDVAHLSWGMTLIAMGRDAEAVAHLKLSAELKPHSSQAFDNLGIALAHLKRYLEAEEAFQKSLSLSPNKPLVLLRLGLVLMEQKKLDDAEAAFQKALQIDPSQQQAHVYLGFIYVTENRLDGAIEHCREAVRLNPNDQGAQNNLAIVLSKKAAQRQLP